MSATPPETDTDKPADPGPTEPVSDRGLSRRAREALRHVPKSFGEALFGKVALIGVVVASVLGLLLPLVLSGLYGPAQTSGANFLIDSPAETTGATPAGIASSFILNLILLSTMLMMLPLRPDRNWDFSRVWLRVTLWSVFAFLGLLLSPWDGMTRGTAASLLAITIAHAAGWGGAGALLALLAGRFNQAARLFLVLVFALFVSAILWSRPLLLSLKKHDHHNQVQSADGRGTRWSGISADAILALGPTTALAGVWSTRKDGFDLIMGPNTYRFWIGAWVISYPQLWPKEVATRGAPPGMTHWAPGLVLGLLIWGLVLLPGCDLLSAVAPRNQPRPT